MKDRTAWKFSFLVPEKLSSVTLIFSEHCSFPCSRVVLWTLRVLRCWLVQCSDELQVVGRAWS